jgi:8-oxo-dGTP pyrophosphatase MutT (NUDIX family)
MAIIERAVEFAPGAEVELYHAVGQQDYVAIVAALPDGRIAVVRQYRPALETFTWEFPAGLVDEGEDPIATCRRELLEETGLTRARCTRSALLRRAQRGCRTGYIRSSLKPHSPAMQPSAGLSLSWLHQRSWQN